jgi:hypothetical protein
MHKRMLALSARLAGMPAAARDPHLVDLLYRGQANDAYWHGLFGGLYLPHLRRSVWHDLLQLEAALNRLAPPPATESADIDLDGHDELFLRSGDIQAVARLDGFAAIHELSVWDLAHNFGDTLRRHAEHYHRKLEQGPSAAASGGGIASPHERLEFKHEITPADTVADSAPRGLFVDAYSAADGATRQIAGYAPSGAQSFVAAGDGWRVEKRLSVAGRRLTAHYRFEGTPPARFECQINLAMPSCDGYSGRYILADGSIPCGFGQPLALDAVGLLTLDDRELKGGVALHASRPLRLAAAPHQTVSQSEAGFEKIMQAACLTLSWPPGAGEETSITLEVLVDAS